MTIYSLILFSHVISAIGLFISLTAEGPILIRIRSSQSTEQARFFIRAFERLRIIAIPSFLGILGGGLYLASRWGGGTVWIPLALGATLLIMLVGGLVTGRKMARLKKILTSEEFASFEAVSIQIKDSSFLISYGLRIGLALGIVFLMTAKPELVPSLLGLGVGCVVGLLVSRGIRRISGRAKMRCQQWGQPADPMVPQNS